MRFRVATVNGDFCQVLRLKFFAVSVTTLSFVALFVGPSFSESAAQQQPPAQQQKTLAAEELSSLRQEAVAGDASAQCVLGAAYASGDGVAQHYAQSALWYLRSAQQGLAKAQYELGSLYVSGQGVLTGKADALMWLGPRSWLPSARFQLVVGFITRTRSAATGVKTIKPRWKLEESALT